VASVVAAARGGYKSGQQVLLAEMGIDPEVDPPVLTNELSNKEKAQLTWINYLPAAGLTASALGATTGLHIVHVKEKKALAATALLAIEEVKKEAGKYEKALQEVGIAKSDNPEELEKAADKKGVARVMDTDGVLEELYLVRDGRTGRDIWSSEERIRRAILDVNEQLMREGDCDLNYFYTYAGYQILDEDAELGWSGEKVDVIFKNNVRDDGRPVREFTFRPKPKSGHQSRA
jgi:hypothetical protein